MHRQESRAERHAVGTTWLRMAAGEFATYLDQLFGCLDTTTFAATLKLMIQETRQAIGRERALIALQRLDNRNDGGTGQLRNYAAVEGRLMALHAAHVDGNYEDAQSRDRSTLLGAERPNSQSRAGAVAAGTVDAVA